MSSCLYCLQNGTKIHLSSFLHKQQHDFYVELWCFACCVLQVQQNKNKCFLREHMKMWSELTPAVTVLLYHSHFLSVLCTKNCIITSHNISSRSQRLSQQKSKTLLFIIFFITKADHTQEQRGTSLRRTRLLILFLSSALQNTCLWLISCDCDHFHTTKKRFILPRHTDAVITISSLIPIRLDRLLEWKCAAHQAISFLWQSCSEPCKGNIK